MKPTLSFVVLCLALLCAINVASADPIPVGTQVEFKLKGDPARYYPVYFEDGEWDRGMFVLNIHRANIHTDQEWYGSMLVQIRHHATNWGHASNFLDYDVHMGDPKNNGPMIAAIAESHSRRGLIVWLRGNFTYFYNSNHVITTCHETSGADGKIVLMVFEGQEMDVFLPRNDIDPQMEKAGRTDGLNLQVKGDLKVLGNIGVGTLEPTHKLTVNGAIRAKEMIVDTNWADDVFSPDYELVSLADVKEHISQQGRLPGVPSAANVAKSGISVGEAHAILLRKIEELTLHVIKQQEQMQKMNEEIQTLRSKIE